MEKMRNNFREACLSRGVRGFSLRINERKILRTVSATIARGKTIPMVRMEMRYPHNNPTRIIDTIKYRTIFK